MAYQANRGGSDSSDVNPNSVYEQKKAEDARSTQNNANNLRNAADVAMASKNPYAMAAGAAVKAADKVTGGKSTEALGKALTRANKVMPGGKKLQKASNKLNESGASDKIGKAASMANGAKGGAPGAPGGVPGAAPGAAGATAGPKPSGGVASTPGGAGNGAKTGGGQSSSLPSSSGESSAGRKKSSSDSSKDGEQEKKGGGLGSFLAKQMIVTVVFSVMPFLLIILLFILVISMVTGIFGDYEDAFGMSSTLGEETGGLYFNASSPEQQEFYDRINDVKLSYVAQGRSFDAMMIVGIYHALKANGVDIQYDDVTTSVIRRWANAMFDGNYYNEEVFRDHLIHDIFPSYLPGKSENYYKEMADEVFDYLERYYNLIGKESFGSSCSSIGSCSYNIKGFSINGKNVIKNMQIRDLKVRLMECGSPYGNGSYTKPIDQDLVNFEDYVAGVAYAEVGPSASDEVLKAQMVAARSFALARPTAMGNAAGKKLAEENGQWVLQISSCVADQVFCNIDQGCSFMGGGDGQGGICRSGKVAGAVRTRDPLPADHAIRRAAAETQGEVLVNNQGYIVSPSYTSTTQNKWASLASQGYNYKQILIQTYNQGSANFGVTDIQKFTCNSDGSSSCISTGEFSKWMQGAPEWGSVPMGSSGKTISQIGCLVTSVSMLIAKSGVPVNINPFNPGAFVQYLNSHGGFASGGNFVWGAASQVAPSFHYQGQISLAGMNRAQKLTKIKEIVSQNGVYAVVEVKGNTGQHWVAIDSVTDSTINMMDPASESTDMWSQYNWANTSTIAYYRVG